MILLIKKALRLHITLIFLSSVLTINAKSEPKPNDEKKFVNQELLNNIFGKLYNLEQNKKGKINIVHIGDSHIQADIFTNVIRQALQSEFGNGGYGFTFPYRLIGTNGSYSVKYVSNANWQSLLNVYPVADIGIGLSGIALYTSSKDFILELSAEPKYEFNTVKIIYPTEAPQYRVSVTPEPMEVISTTIGSNISTGQSARTHKIKSGENLSVIARKYGVTVTQIRNANGLKSNNIRAGRTLRIPTKGNSVRKSKTRVSTVKVKDDIEYVNITSKPYYSTYTSDTLLSRIAILPNGDNATYNLNGFVIENDKPGIVYHTIGVNGSKVSDYDKYPLFYKQLPILNPDLVIVSFGTNESFGKLTASEYIYQVKQFVKKIRTHCGPNVSILVMSPPPSLFRRKRANPFVSDYSLALMEMSDVPVWDLYSRMGGLDGIRNSTLISRDNVHYTQRGYETQGIMFCEDFIAAYDQFKKGIKH